MKEKMTYMEGYKKPYVEINKKYLPDCKHIADEFKCVEARIMKLGIIERGGEKFEFQDIRIYFKEN